MQCRAASCFMAMGLLKVGPVTGLQLMAKQGRLLVHCGTTWYNQQASQRALERANQSRYLDGNSPLETCLMSSISHESRSCGIDGLVSTGLPTRAPHYRPPRDKRCCCGCHGDASSFQCRCHAPLAALSVSASGLTPSPNPGVPSAMASLCK